MIYGDGRFGDAKGAIGWLVGEENKGLACMFTMMNNARLAVGMQGVAIAEAATQKASPMPASAPRARRPAGAERPSGGDEPDHRASRRYQHADDHEGADAGRPRHRL
jgi:hypothetical protein